MFEEGFYGEIEHTVAGIIDRGLIWAIWVSFNYASSRVVGERMLNIYIQYICCP